MKKILLFTIILFSCFIFTNQVKADTEVGGIIDQNTTWTLANSPYIITSNILIEKNVSLVIEPGVIIKFRKHHTMGEGLYIKVDGILSARGTKNNIIKFTTEDNNPNSEFSWDSISFTEQSNNWIESDNTGNVLENCIIEYGSNGKGAINIINSSPLIKNNLIRNIVGSSNISISISGGNPQIINNNIREGRIIIYEGSPYFKNNKISSTNVGIYIVGGAPTITQNDIIDIESTSSDGGIRIDHSSCPTITYNNIVNNNKGINFVNFENIYSECLLEINNNSIYNNDFAIMLHDVNQSDISSNINLSNNWWGTVNKNEIKNLIYDKDDDFSLATINYKPFLNEAPIGFPINEFNELDEENDNPVLEEEEEENEPTNDPNDNIDTNLSNRLKGKLLLQVNQGGRIWYVNPDDARRFEVTFANALPLFENFALGISDNDLDDIPKHDEDWSSAIGNRLKGKLLLQVEQGGRIWYVDFDSKRWEVTWANLMTLFESLALGITDEDLNKIEREVLVPNNSGNNSSDTNDGDNQNANNIEENKAINNSEKLISAYEDLKNTIGTININLDKILIESDKILGVDDKDINDAFKARLGVKNLALVDLAKNSYIKSKDELNKFNDLVTPLDSNSSYSEIDTVVNQAVLILQEFKEHLYNMKLMLEASISFDQRVFQTTSEDFIAIIDSSKIIIDAKISSLNIKIENISSAKM